MNPKRVYCELLICVVVFLCDSRDRGSGKVWRQTAGIKATNGNR